MTEWAYFIGGPFDLTKRPTPATNEDPRYIQLAMRNPSTLDRLWNTYDPEEMARPVVVETVTYRLATKVQIVNGDIAWIYVQMSTPKCPT